MKKNVLKNSVILMLLLVITKVSGFVKEMIMANIYGASNITDAYSIVVSMSSILFEGFTVAICTAYISVISKQNDDNNKVLKITSNTMLILWGVVFVLSILATIFAKEVCRILAIGFDDTTMQMTVDMAKIVLPIASLFVIKGVLAGFLQVKGSFWYTGIGTFFMNVILIISIAISNRNIYVLAGGYVMAAIVVTLIGVVASKKHNFKFRPKIEWQDKELITILQLAIPIFIAQTVMDLNLLIDRNFASVMGEGMISIFNYANKLNVLFIAIFAQAFATVLFPEFSSSLDKNKKINDKFQYMVMNAGEIAVFVMLPIAIFVMGNAKEIVDIAFGRGAFTIENVIVTGNILQIYAMTLPIVTLIEILTKTFYAIEDSKKPMLLSILALLVNLILNFILMKYMGYKGLALATLLSTILQLIGLGIMLKTISLQSAILPFLKHSLKCIVATIPVWLVSVMLFGFTECQEMHIICKLLVLCVEFLLGIIIYVMITRFMHINFIDIFIDKMKRRKKG